MGLVFIMFKCYSQKVEKKSFFFVVVVVLYWKPNNANNSGEKKKKTSIDNKQNIGQRAIVNDDDDNGFVFIEHNDIHGPPHTYNRQTHTHTQAIHTNRTHRARHMYRTFIAWFFFYLFSCSIIFFSVRFDYLCVFFCYCSLFIPFACRCQMSWSTQHFFFINSVCICQFIQSISDAHFEIAIFCLFFARGRFSISFSLSSSLVFSFSRRLSWLFSSKTLTGPVESVTQKSYLFPCRSSISNTNWYSHEQRWYEIKTRTISTKT